VIKSAAARAILREPPFGCTSEMLSFITNRSAIWISKLVR
jgi:hypothetical protein